MKYQVIIIGGGPAGYTAAEAAGKPGFEDLSYHNGYEQNRTDEL